MKKIISIAFAAILAGLAISCQKEELVSDKTDAVQYTFNIIVNDRSGFDNDASTKGSESHKSCWENGDKIFLFFKPTDVLLDDTYATLTYNGSSWDGTVTPGQSRLGDGGTLSAVYVYKLDGSVTPAYSDNKWTIATGNTFYNCQTGVDYTISDNVISASLDLVAPTNFVQFYVASATGALTCDQVKGWKDIAIGSDMDVSNVTCTGYMDGFVNSGDSNVKEYYGRIVDGTSLNGKACEFSVVKNDKVYERSATPSSDARSFKMNTSDGNWQEAVGKLPGLFTVGKGADGKAGTADDVQVRFSQGNLTYDVNASTNKWKFYEHQYDCATGYDPYLISLFTWGYGTWSTSPNGTDYQTGDFTDWGKAFDDKGTWRTLSTAEWQYLFNYGDYKSDVRNGKYKWATVNSVGGYVIAPDGFVGTLADLYADDAALAADNLVFLPAAGYRSGSRFRNVGGSGIYWSSTAYDEGNAYDVDFDGDDVSPDYNDSRGLGFSVRLITESK